MAHFHADDSDDGFGVPDLDTDDLERSLTQGDLHSDPFTVTNFRVGPASKRLRGYGSSKEVLGGLPHEDLLGDPELDSPHVPHRNFSLGSVGPSSLSLGSFGPSNDLGLSIGGIGLRGSIAASPIASGRHNAGGFKTRGPASKPAPLGHDDFVPFNSPALPQTNPFPAPQLKRKASSPKAPLKQVKTAVSKKASPRAQRQNTDKKIKASKTQTPDGKRERRSKHNAAERSRTRTITQKIKRLHELLVQSQRTVKNEKLHIITAALDYMRELHTATTSGGARHSNGAVRGSTPQVKSESGIQKRESNETAMQQGALDAALDAAASGLGPYIVVSMDNLRVLESSPQFLSVWRAATKRDKLDTSSILSFLYGTADTSDPALGKPSKELWTTVRQVLGGKQQTAHRVRVVDSIPVTAATKKLWFRLELSRFALQDGKPGLLALLLPCDRVGAGPGGADPFLELIAADGQTSALGGEAGNVPAVKTDRMIGQAAAV